MKRKLVVGRDPAVYFYETEEKGICFGFEGMKTAIAWFNSYLIVVGEQTDRETNKQTDRQTEQKRSMLIWLMMCCPGVR